MEENQEKIVISTHAKKRILKDVLNLIKNPLTEHGIFYKHDANHMLKGRAIIIGPKDTIYEYGIYEFKFIFPTNYPFSPPKLKYITNDGNNTRFHPNLYRNGKVCLSILNTWSGDQWTSCQSLSTVLLTLTTLFHNKSLLNEPGINENHRDFENYHTVIQYRNYQYAVNSKLYDIYKLYMIKKHDKDLFNFIYDKIITHKNAIIDNIKKLIDSEKDNVIIKTNIYTMNANIEYINILNETNEIFSLYSKIKTNKNKKTTNKKTNK